MFTFWKQPTRASVWGQMSQDCSHPFVPATSTLDFEDTMFTCCLLYPTNFAQKHNDQSGSVLFTSHVSGPATSSEITKDIYWLETKILNNGSFYYLVNNTSVNRSMLSCCIVGRVNRHISTYRCNLCVFCVVGRRLNITAEADCRKLHCALRDLSSLLQAVGRLAEFFTGEVFTARFNDALAIVQRFVIGFQIVTEIRLFANLFTEYFWLVRTTGCNTTLAQYWKWYYI